MAQNDEMTTPIAPGVATPGHPNNSIGLLIFDNQTRSMLQIGQHPLSLSNLDPGVRTNSDGSVDVYRSDRPGEAANRIRTTSNRFRAAAPEKSATTQTAADPRRLQTVWKEQSNENDHLCNAGAWSDGGSAG
jgi:hypothetical protein